MRQEAAFPPINAAINSMVSSQLMPPVFPDLAAMWLQGKHKHCLYLH